jgi:hypothetical protein
MEPILDLVQTVPIFASLVPNLFAAARRLAAQRGGRTIEP